MQDRQTATLWDAFVSSGGVTEYLRYSKEKRDSEEPECNKPYLPW